MPAFTSTANAPSPPLRAQTVASSIAGWAHACASATFAPAASRTVPEMRWSGCSSTQSAAGPLARSATRVVSCQRCSAGPLTRTKYVPGAPKSVTPPSAPAVAHAGVLEDARAAHTRAPETGRPPSFRVTRTRNGMLAPAVAVVPTVGVGVVVGVELHAMRNATAMRTIRRDGITADNVRSAPPCRRRAGDHARDLGERARDLFPALSLHEVVHRLADRLALRQHQMRLLGYRHGDAFRPRGEVRRLRGGEPFRDLAAEPFADGRGAEAFREELSD